MTYSNGIILAVSRNASFRMSSIEIMIMHDCGWARLNASISIARSSGGRRKARPAADWRRYRRICTRTASIRFDDSLPRPQRPTLIDALGECGTADFGVNWALRKLGMSHRECAGPDRSIVVRRGRWLQYATLATCSLEAIVALAAGWAGHSVALIGFGLDSAIEVTSGAAVLWRLQRDHDLQRRAAAERLALRIVGWCFVALAIYIAADSTVTLWRREIPARSWAGIAVAAFSIVFMP